MRYLARLSFTKIVHTCATVSTRQPIRANSQSMGSPMETKTPSPCAALLERSHSANAAFFVHAAIGEDEMLALVSRHFDLRPAAITHRLDLRRPIYRPTAAFGHFGRDDLDQPWERTDVAEALRTDASASLLSTSA